MSTIKVLIDGDALGSLMDHDFNLCLTRDVEAGGRVLQGNVVFAMVPTKVLAPHIELEWEDKYQVFETASFKEGAKVTSGTNFVNIRLGQLVTFDAHGNGKATGEEDRNRPFRVRNEWKEFAYVGVRSYDPSTNTDNSLFLSPEVLTETTSEIAPTKKFSVFWNRHLVTDTIIDDTVSDPYAFEITGNEITIKYSKEEPHWSQV